MIAVLTASTLFGIAALHLYWALGGHWGKEVSVPERDGRPLFVPSVKATVTVAALLTAAGAIVLARAGWLPGLLPLGLSKIGSSTVGLVLLGRAIGNFRSVGIFKQIRGTRFAALDTAVYSPLCAALAAGCIVVALDE
jgi:fatty acid desaturase